MVFSSTIFLLLFLPVVLVVYYNPLFKSRAYRNVILFFASIVFYAWGEPIFVFVLLLSIFITWSIGLIMEKGTIAHKKLILAIGITLHVLLLFSFKYLGFIAQQLGLLIHRDFSSISIALPIGISFFTFQLMSYLFDIYYGKAQSQKNVLYVGLYVSMFPQLIAGPIIRYNEVADAIQHRKESRQDITAGVFRFIFGLAKKVLIANFVAQIADNIFAISKSVELSVLGAWLGSITYALQIYYDFSGYSDMAIGLGKIFGFHFSENFNYPYVSKSITEFWRRWHISLSTWFRDYVYIPLGGSQVSKARWIRNLLIVWLLTGIWHGANWTFMLWGLFYFVMLLFEKLTDFTKKIGWFSHIYTMCIVLIAWVLFRSNNVGDAIKYVGYMFGIGSKGFTDASVTSYIINGKWILLFGFLLSMPVVPWLKKKISPLQSSLKNMNGLIFDVIESLTVLILFVLSLLVTISSSYNPFIYFNF